MVDSHICIDTGNSGTKIIYSTPESEQMNSLFMSSALDEVAPLRLENQLKHLSWIGFPQPEQQAWVKVDDNLIAVGQLAEKFSPADGRNIPKYENALYKILAAIGVIIENHFMPTRRRIKIQLGLLLPWNEYKDRKRLEQEIQRITSEYEFRTHKVKVKIERFICYPEGGGIAMARIKANGLSWFKQERLGVLMLGDRNWTGLYFEQGQIKQGASPLEGFSFLLDRVIENAPCLLNREKLNHAIFNAIIEANKKQHSASEFSWCELEAIESLATARKISLRKSEIHDIDRAIALVAKDWFDKLKRFLKETFPQKLTEVNVCGGTLPFFKPSIENYFNCAVGDSTHTCSPIDIAKSYTPVLANGGITEAVTETLRFKSITAIESAYPVRFADVFSLMEYMVAQEKKLIKQTK